MATERLTKDGCERKVLVCKNGVKNNINIYVFMRDPSSSKTVTTEMRMKKAELREVCMSLSKSIRALDNNNHFNNFFKTSLILSKDISTDKYFCKLISIFPDISINFSPIEPLNISPFQAMNKFGFLGIDCNRKRIIPLDISHTNTIPLIGIWSTPNTNKELLLGVVLKFLFCDKMRAIQGEDFVYAEYNMKKECIGCYSFQVKTPTDPWVMQVLSSEFSQNSNLQIQLTTNKRLAKEQENCSLYKLPRNVINENNTRRASSILTNYRETSNKENIGSNKTIGCKIRLSGKNTLRDIINKKSNENKEQKVIPLQNRVSLVESNNVPLKSKVNYTRMDRPKSAYSRYQGKSQNKSITFARQIISQQQTQIQLLQQQIIQVMSTLQLMGKPTKQPIPLFALNDRFKENMKNCQQLNIENDLGQDSPSFMKSKGNSVSYFDKKEIIEALPLQKKMLSSIKETNESTSSLGGNFTETLKNTTREEPKNKINIRKYI